jgi:creatinine amidohydrolase/Fe(II)-dependent formamide hydrolase-like protein
MSITTDTGIGNSIAEEVAEGIAKGNAILPPGYKAAKSYKHVAIPEADWLKLYAVSKKQDVRMSTIIKVAIKQLYDKIIMGQGDSSK